MRFALLILFALPAQAHMMSLSSGDATLEGTKLSYTLTMPLFEVAHIKQPDETLLTHIQFTGARLLEHECHADQARDSYICHATYRFPAPPEKLEVHCTFPEITVPNHLHLLRAVNGAKHDQVVFDSAFTSATLRFRPPTQAELAAQQSASAAAHVVTGLLPLLFLVTLALAAANWRQLAVITAIFLTGQLAGALIPWQPSPRFLESAAALAVAYLAVEVLFLPNSKARWLVAAALGMVPGLVLAAHIRQAESSLFYAFLGTALVDLLVLGVTAAFTFRFPQTRRLFAALTLATGLGWFVLVISR